jgi:acetyltransferase-like isoleucine patch superfamily enzyme
MYNPIPRLKGRLIRMTCPLFYKKIGRKCEFYGRVRLPDPLRNVTIGDRCMIGDSVFFFTGRSSFIEIGNDCSLNSGCHVVANESIVIGDNCAIGEFTSIRDQAHRFTPETGVRDQGFTIAPVRIGENCWIGRGVFIGPGSSIGKGCIIAANSVVHGTFPPNVLLAGAPAKIKKTLT